MVRERRGEGARRSEVDSLLRSRDVLCMRMFLGLIPAFNMTSSA